MLCQLSNSLKTGKRLFEISNFLTRIVATVTREICMRENALSTYEIVFKFLKNWVSVRKKLLKINEMKIKKQ